MVTVKNAVCREVKGMTRKRRCGDELRREFQSTVTEELLPGILHNFANPLNGIMGRSKLLQKRAVEALGVTEFGQGEPSKEIREKILRDVDLLVEQGDRLYDLFSQVAAKVQRLNDKNEGPINLSELLADEVAFCDYYLDFKHSIEKSVNLDMGVPSVMGSPADYSLALSSILRYSMSVMKDVPVRILSVFSDYDSERIILAISDSGVHDEEAEYLFRAVECGDLAVEEEALGGCRGLYWALALLKEYDVRSLLDTGGGINKITLKVPYNI